MNNQQRKQVWIVLLGLLPGVAAADVEYGLRMKGAYYMEDPRDLGLPPADPAIPPAEKISSFYADLNPYLHVPFDEKSGFFARVQLFGTAGDSVFQQESERAVPSKNFAALRELYFDYGGLSSFPGEVLRFGLQRVRDADGMWWDRDLESLRWMFDTTLLQTQIGIGEQFNTYRTDDITLTPSQRHRGYAFFSLGDQWQPGYFNQVRVAYAQDHSQLPEIGTTPGPDDKTRNRKYLWVGLITHNGYYDPRSTIPVHYWLQAVGLGGRRESVQTNPLDPAAPDQVIGHVSDKVIAFAGDAGLRIRFPLIFPLEIGALAAYAEGDPGPGGTSHVFEPTGLESNRSRFTGGRTLSNRFSEALQAHWSNLRSAGGLLSMPSDMADFSAIYQVFQRDSGNSSFQADGISAQIDPANTSRDIGHTIDLVLTKFFEGFGIADTLASHDEDSRSNVRLRAGRFYPGEAYGAGAAKETRVTVEATLWF